MGTVHIKYRSEKYLSSSNECHTELAVQFLFLSDTLTIPLSQESSFKTTIVLRLMTKDFAPCYRVKTNRRHLRRLTLDIP